MKKHFLFVLLVLLSSLLLWGCSDADKTSGVTPTPYTEPQYDWNHTTGKTLTLWSRSPETERVYIKRAIENYESATGNHIEITQYSQDEFERQVAKAYSSGSQIPDLLLTYGGTNMDSFNPDDNFYDFTDAQWVDDLTDTSINQAIYHGKVMGLPHWEASISGTLYNKKIFDSLHLDIPRTQDEFLEVCQTLLEHKITPVYLPFSAISMLLYQFPLDVLVEDTEILDSLNNGSLAYADMPEMKQVLNWYKTMADSGYFGEDYLTASWDKMSAAMKSGKYAMMLCWDTWLYTDYDGDPSDYGLMPAFMGIPEGGTFEGPNLGLVTVSKNSPNLDAALDFVTFLADPYNYNQAFKGIYTAPVFKHQTASISTPQYTQAQSLIEQNFYDSVSWLRIKGFSQMDASCIIEYLSSDGKMTQEECLHNMDALRLKRSAD